MLSLVIKDDKCTKLLYVEHDNNKLYYHGVKLIDNSVYDIGKNIINEVYDLIKVKPNHKYINDYEGYQVYYDKDNNLKHFLKNGKEDLLMFYYHNGINAEHYKGDNKNHHSKFKEFIVNGVKVKIALTLVTIFIACQSSVTSNFINDYLVYQPSIEYAAVETISTDEAINLIQSSPNLNQTEKEFLSNRELLNDVLPLYKGTDMAYIIKERLNNLNIIYEDLDDDIGGCYRGDNSICLKKDLKDIDYNSKEGQYKLGVLAHEFVHLLQAIDCPNYLKEATAELISKEYFFHHTDCNSYTNATKNLKLLIETMGPKYIWEYTFSGKGNSFNDYISKYLTTHQHNQLKEYFNDLADDYIDYEENYQIHQNICELIELLYKNIYHQDISSNSNIFLGYGISGLLSEYVDKQSYFYQYDEKAEYISLTYDEVQNLNLLKDTDAYHYVKLHVSPLERNMSVALKSFNNNLVVKDIYTKNVYYNEDNDFFKYKIIQYKDKKPHVIDGAEYLRFYFEDGSNIKIKLNEALDKGIVEKVDYTYDFYTLKEYHPLNDRVIFMGKASIKIPKDDSLKEVGNDLYQKKLETIKDRFPNQIIKSDEKSKIL